MGRADGSRAQRGLVDGRFEDSVVGKVEGVARVVELDSA